MNEQGVLMLQHTYGGVIICPDAQIFFDTVSEITREELKRKDMKNAFLKVGTGERKFGSEEERYFTPDAKSRTPEMTLPISKRKSHPKFRLSGKTILLTSIEPDLRAQIIANNAAVMKEAFDEEIKAFDEEIKVYESEIEELRKKIEEALDAIRPIQEKKHATQVRFEKNAAVYDGARREARRG